VPNPDRSDHPRRCPERTFGRQATPADQASTDEHGLVLTTNSDAAAHYRIGTRQLLGGDARALDSYANALLTDRAFALAHAGAAAALHAAAAAHGPSLLAARTAARQATRRERQHIEVLTAAMDGETSRAMALGSQHLHEFASDVVVLHVLTNAVAFAEDDTLQSELLRLVAVIVPWGADPKHQG